MTGATFRGLTLVTLIAAAATGGSQIGRAEQAAATPDVLAALLVEVRGLRGAMEQMAAAGPRVQLVLGRVQMQEQRIANQIRRLDSVTASLVLARKLLQPLEEDLKTLGEPGPEPVDESARRDREWELSQTKIKWARARADVQRLTAEENILSQELANEQARWLDFNQRLDELERALARR